MKFKLFALAALMAAGSAQAAIDNGADGSGDLFFSIWDANGSYTRDLNIDVDGFDLAIAAPGALNLSFTSDNLFTSFLAGTAGGVRAGVLQWNIVGMDGSGPRRMPSTVDGTYVGMTSLTVRNTVTAATAFANDVNGSSLFVGDSGAFTSADLPYAGRATFGMSAGAGLVGQDTTGTLANSSYSSGLTFLQIKGNGTGTAVVAPLNYADEANSVKAFLDGNNVLHLASAAPTAPVPEADTYAFMALGMGLVGLLARRRKAA
jgi:hypothetical protein